MKSKRKIDSSLVLAWMAVISYVIALIFISFNITGNVVAETNPGNYQGIGIGTFLLGLSFTFFYFKAKKR